jgi:hypothetical protein
MFIPIISAKTFAAAESYKISQESGKFSHLMIYASATDDIVTESKKCVLTIKYRGKGLDKNQIEQVSLFDLANWSDLCKGTGIDATGDKLYIELALGNIEIDGFSMDFTIDMSAPEAGQSLTLDMQLVREMDANFPALKYSKRTLTTQGFPVENCLFAYDCGSAVNDTEKSVLRFMSNGSELNIEHKIGYMKLRTGQKLTASNTLALIYADKDMSTGRDFQISPSSGYDLFYVTIME